MEDLYELLEEKKNLEEKNGEMIMSSMETEDFKIC